MYFLENGLLDPNKGVFLVVSDSNIYSFNHY